MNGCAFVTRGVAMALNHSRVARRASAAWYSVRVTIELCSRQHFFHCLRCAPDVDLQTPPHELDAFEACAALSDRRRLAPSGGGKPGESPVMASEEASTTRRANLVRDDDEKDSCGTTVAQGRHARVLLLRLKDRCLPCCGCG